MKSRKYKISFATMVAKPTLMGLSAILIGTLFIISNAGVCQAQSSASQSTPSSANVPHALKLDDAIHAAMARNYSVKTAENTARYGDIDVTRAKDNMWLPTVNGSGSWGYNYSLDPISVTEPITTVVSLPGGGDSVIITGYTQKAPAGSQSLSYDVTANLNLFNGGGDMAKIGAAEATFGAAKNTSKWTRQETAFNVTSDYLNVLRTNELVGAAKKTLDEAVAQVKLVQGQYDAGVVPIVQLYQQDAVVGQDSLLLIQAVNAYQNAEITLLFVLNIPPNEYQSYTFSAEGIDTSTSVQAQNSVDTSISPDRFNPAIDTRPDIIAQQQSIEAGQDQVEVTRAGLLPKLTASAGIGGAGANADLTKIRMSNGLNLGLNLSVPIFDAMQTRLAIDEEEITVENQQLALQQDVQQARSDATGAVINLQSAREALNASDVALKSATEGLRLAEEQLNVGSGTEVTVVVAEAAIETARTNRVNAKYNWVLAQRQLAYTLGEWRY